RVGDFATAAVAVAVEIAGGTVRRAGIALTGVGSTTVHAAEAGESLVGGALTEAAIELAAELAANVAKPRTDHRGSATYKRHIVNTFTARVLRGVAESQEKVA
ncbi:MAG: xanthine dehydrogenase family protein subunit M, partial [Ilumatobacteraceae bacterium]